MPRPSVPRREDRRPGNHGRQRGETRVTVLLASTAGEVIVWIVWIVAALALLVSGFAVVLFSNPFYSALALIGNLASLAVLYLLLSAEFVAAAQVLVYAGAVMVMFLFVIAYIGHRADEPFAGGRSLARVAAVVAAVAIFIEVVIVLVQDAGGRLSTSADVTDSFGSPREIGALFLSDHLLAFEVTSIILLVGAVGGVVLGSGTRDRRRGDDEEGGTVPVGQPPEAA